MTRKVRTGRVYVGQERLLQGGLNVGGAFDTVA